MRSLAAIACVVGIMAHADVATAVEVIAHRGESADAPENTLAAFQLAWQRGVTAVELDAHLTKDNRLVVIHDADTQRTGGEKRSIQESLLDDLLGLDVGRWKHSQYAGQRIPTLEQVLELVPPGTRCFIEVKVGPEAVPALVQAVQRSGKCPEQLCIISFKADTVAEAKRCLPQLQAYYVAEFCRDEQTGQWTPSVDELIAEAKSIGADGLDVSYQGPLDAAAVCRIHAAGLQVYTWTVDDLDVAQRLTAMGVDGITTNKAGWMNEQLSPAAGLVQSGHAGACPCRCPDGTRVRGFRRWFRR